MGKKKKPENLWVRLDFKEGDFITMDTWGMEVVGSGVLIRTLTVIRAGLTVSQSESMVFVPDAEIYRSPADDKVLVRKIKL